MNYPHYTNKNREKKFLKTQLTSKRETPKLRRMQTTTSMREAKKLLKSKTPPIEQQYNQVFVPKPSTLWQEDDDNFSLEQPHSLEDVPSETVWILPALTQLCPNCNA